MTCCIHLIVLSSNPPLMRSGRVWRPSILKCLYFTNMSSAFRFITGLCPPSFFSTRKIYDTKPVREGVVSITATIILWLPWRLSPLRLWSGLLLPLALFAKTVAPVLVCNPLWLARPINLELFSSLLWTGLVFQWDWWLSDSSNLSTSQGGAFEQSPVLTRG